MTDWPRLRNPVVDLLECAHRQHNISAAWEVDFTVAADRMAQIRRTTGNAVSLNAYLIYALGRTIPRHPMMQAVRWRSKGKIATYEGVDVATAVEWAQPGRPPQPVGARISSAHEKSLAQICAEMRRLAKQDPRERPIVRWRAKLARYPGWMRRIVWRWVDAHPQRRRQYRGTIALTNLNFLLDDRRPMYGFPLSPYTSTLTVGALYRRAVPEAGQAVFRRFLTLTLTVDHDLLDGSVAARFARTLTFFLESGEGLDDAFADEMRALRPNRVEVPA